MEGRRRESFEEGGSQPNHVEIDRREWAGRLMEGMWDQEEKEAMQEDTGIRQVLDTQGHFLVLSEGWPSWVFALQGAGASSIDFWIEYGRPSMALVLQHLGLKESRCWTYGSAFHKLQAQTRVLIQGSKTFVQTHMTNVINAHVPLDRIVAIEDISIGADCHNPVYDKAYMISHRQVGGITNGRWAVFAPVVHDKAIMKERLNIRRFIGDVVSSTVGGKASDPPHHIR